MLKAIIFATMLQTALFSQGSDGRVCDVRYAPLGSEWRVEVMYEEYDLSVTLSNEGEFRYVTYFK